MGSAKGIAEAGMWHSAYARANLVFLLVLALSALTMVWLFWHHPLKTLIATIAVLAALGVSARLARSVDTDGSSDLEHGERSI
jgi:membrane protein implicated in regulation of membrane protease activity